MRWAARPWPSASPSPGCLGSLDRRSGKHSPLGRATRWCSAGGRTAREASDWAASAPWRAPEA
eukprot:6889576-Alexandrium_andersonii.AAC.1